MATDTIQNISINVPKNDLKFFKAMAKKMGWTIQPKKKSGISKGNYYANIDHSIKQAEDGEVIKQQDGENVEQFIDRLLCTK